MFVVKIIPFELAGAGTNDANAGLAAIAGPVGQKIPTTAVVT
jgi:hypothetical protein